MLSFKYDRGGGTQKRRLNKGGKHKNKKNSREKTTKKRII